MLTYRAMRHVTTCKLPVVQCTPMYSSFICTFARPIRQGSHGLLCLYPYEFDSCVQYPPQVRVPGVVRTLFVRSVHPIDARHPNQRGELY